MELTTFDNRLVTVDPAKVMVVEEVRDGAVLKMRGGGSLTVQESAAYVRSLLPQQGVVTR